MPRPSDRALRRVVADLARAHPHDIEEIMARLDPPHQAKVRCMLGAYIGRELAEPISSIAEAAQRADAEPRQAPLPEGLSPWLLARLQAGRSDGSAPGFDITVRASAALRASAAGLPAAEPLRMGPLRTSERRPKAWRRRLAGQT